MALPQWFGRSHSDVGHIKHTAYYLSDVLAVTEPPLLAGFASALLFPIVNALIHFVRDEPQASFFGRHQLLARFLIVWTTFTLFVYAAIGYKTVWLIPNMSVPMSLVVALFLSTLVENKTAFVRLSGVFLTAIFVFVTWKNTLKYNFTYSPLSSSDHALTESYPYGKNNPFSYVHTSPSLLKLVAKVNEYWEKYPDAKLLMGTPSYFPLPYYLRHKASQIAYLVPANVEAESANYDMMILDFYKHKWSSPFWDQQYYRLSDYAEAYGYFKKRYPN